MFTLRRGRGGGGVVTSEVRVGHPSENVEEDGVGDEHADAKGHPLVLCVMERTIPSRPMGSGC